LKGGEFGKGGDDALRSTRFLAAASGLALLLTGCASDTPRKGFIPSGPVTTSLEELSGEYCYYGPDFNIRSYYRSPEAIPFVDVSAFGEPTKITVDATAEQIVFTFTGDDGVQRQQLFQLEKFKAAWRENALAVSWEQGGGRKLSPGEAVASVLIGVPAGLVIGILTGFEFSESGRESRIFRLPDGRLAMTDSFRTTGYSDRGRGFYEEEDSVAVFLDPAAGDCAGGPPDRPMEPLFEKGLDLRDPACAAQLEEAIVSILVEKGEAPETVAAVARETVIGLRNDEKLWTEFRVAPAPIVSYVFVVGRSGTKCRLRLESRTKSGKNSVVTVGGIFLSGKRPLPACACS